jgi:hypothetical protein
MHDYRRPPVSPLLPGGHGLLGLVDFDLIGDGVLVSLDRGGVRCEDHRAVVAGKVGLLILGDLDADIPGEHEHDDRAGEGERCQHADHCAQPEGDRTGDGPTVRGGRHQRQVKTQDDGRPPGAGRRGCPSGSPYAYRTR